MLKLGLVMMSMGLVHAAPNKESIRSDWKQFYDQAQVDGTMAVFDRRDNTQSTLIYNAERAKRRFVQASTYKIPHPLFALDAGVVRNEFQMIK